MIKTKKIFFVVYLLSPVMLLLSGCQKYGKLDEGECKIEFNLSNIPISFNDLPDNLKGILGVELILKNVSNEKEYKVLLNKENGYKAEASLNQGTYQVEQCKGNYNEIFKYTPELKTESITLKKGEKPKKLKVAISDKAEFDKCLKNTMPTEKILKKGIFSRTIQIDGRVIDMKNILKEDLEEFKNMSKPFDDITVDPGRDKVSGEGITVEVYNSSTKTLPVSKCKVLSVEIKDNVAVLPKGLRLGLSLSDVINADKGLYKTPDKCKGILMLYDGIDDFDCTYNDEESGDKLTINFNSRWYVEGFKYECEVYE